MTECIFLYILRCFNIHKLDIKLKSGVGRNIGGRSLRTIGIIAEKRNERKSQKNSKVIINTINYNKTNESGNEIGAEREEENLTL